MVLAWSSSRKDSLGRVASRVGGAVGRAGGEGMVSEC